jgi:urea transport system permease protein
MRLASTWILAGSCVAVLLAAGPSVADEAQFVEALGNLKTSSFITKTEAAKEIAASDAEQAFVVLGALLEGRLYVRKAENDVVVAVGSGDEVEIASAAHGGTLGAVAKTDLKRIIINNQMRIMLRSDLARLSLRATDPAQRRKAIVSLFDSLNEQTVKLMRAAFVTEEDAAVKATLATALALADLDSLDTKTQIAAAQTLGSSMHTAVRNRLAALVESGADDALDEQGRQLLATAKASLAQIEHSRKIYGLVETTFFGLSLGFVLVLAATGLAITFGVMGVINMAHGELMMLGAYSTWVVQQAMPEHLELSLFVAVPVAFIVAGLVGVAIERGVVRFLYGRPLETLLATFGVSLLLQQTVRTIFSPLNRAVATPEWMSGQLYLNDALSINYNRLYIIIFSIVVFLSLVTLLRYTTLGLQIRAVAQNRNMAKAMGVRGGWIDAVTFGLGSGVAGLAGVALSQLTNVGPNLGQSHIVDSFMVVVFGGVGNLWGTLMAGLSLGIANKFLEPFAGAVLAKIFVLVFIILFIQRYPRGLFPQRGRAAES